MNLLYLGRYKQRFTQVIKQIKDLPPNSQILELCFGDIYIAKHCKSEGLRWKGIDLNNHFVSQARKLGYNAAVGDLASDEQLPKADACIMMGSLYHFHPGTFAILKKMTSSSNTIIISEPVQNLSSNRGLVGFLARRAANAGKGNETFRFDANSFRQFIEEHCERLDYKIDFANQYGKDFVIKLIKNEFN